VCFVKSSCTVSNIELLKVGVVGNIQKDGVEPYWGCLGDSFLERFLALTVFGWVLRAAGLAVANHPRSSGSPSGVWVSRPVPWLGRLRDAPGPGSSTGCLMGSVYRDISGSGSVGGRFERSPWRDKIVKAIPRQENSKRLGLKESDTERLIAEYRREKRGH